MSYIKWEIMLPAVKEGTREERLVVNLPLLLYMKYIMMKYEKEALSIFRGESNQSKRDNENVSITLWGNEIYNICGNESNNIIKQISMGKSTVKYK